MEGGSVLSTSQLESLIQDVAALVQIFDAIVQAGGVHVRLECLSSNGCQYWHQDTVLLRLVTTYRGPCTEYVHPMHEEETLRRRQHDAAHAQSLTHYDVALFKGRLFADDDDEDSGEADESECVEGNEGNDRTDDDKEILAGDATTEEIPNDGRDSGRGGDNTRDQNGVHAVEGRGMSGDGDIADEGDEDDEIPDLFTSSGIVHRSPRIEGTDVVRLVLILDIPAEFNGESNGDDDSDSICKEEND